MIDASFISLKTLLPSVKNWMQPDATIVALIKPQFEAAKHDVGEGGVIRRKDIHVAVLTDILTWIADQSLTPAGLIASPITGPAGNREFLVHIRLRTISHPSISDMVSACF